MEIRHAFMSTDDLFTVLQEEFSEMVLLHHTKGKWCLHTASLSSGFTGNSPRECVLQALSHFIARREAARLN